MIGQIGLFLVGFGLAATVTLYLLSRIIRFPKSLNPVKKTGQCYLHRKKDATLRCADCGNSICTKCQTKISEYWSTTSISPLRVARTEYSRKAVVCTICDLVAKETILAKKKKLKLIVPITLVILLIIIPGILLLLFGTVTIALIPINLLFSGIFCYYMFAVWSRSYEGRERVGGKKLEVLKKRLETSKCSPEELEMTRNLQKMGVWYRNHYHWTVGRNLMITCILWSGLVFAAVGVITYTNDIDNAIEILENQLMFTLAVFPPMLIMIFTGTLLFFYAKRVEKLRPVLNWIREKKGLEKWYFTDIPLLITTPPYGDEENSTPANGD